MIVPPFFCCLCWEIWPVFRVWESSHIRVTFYATKHWILTKEGYQITKEHVRSVVLFFWPQRYVHTRKINPLGGNTPPKNKICYISATVEFKWMIFGTYICKNGRCYAPRNKILFSGYFLKQSGFSIFRQYHSCWKDRKFCTFWDFITEKYKFHYDIDGLYPHKKYLCSLIIVKKI